jgi:hypothetical protein
VLKRLWQHDFEVADMVWPRIVAVFADVTRDEPTEGMSSVDPPPPSLRDRPINLALRGCRWDVDL